MLERSTRAVLVVIAVALWATLLRPLFWAAPAQAQPAPMGQAGRYQLETGEAGAVYFLDTQTGQLWSRGFQLVGGKPVVRWTQTDSPVSKAP